MRIKKLIAWIGDVGSTREFMILDAPAEKLKRLQSTCF
jgi:hypothetical protein